MLEHLEPYHYDLCPREDPAEDLRIFRLALTGGPDDIIEGQILPLPDDQPYIALSWCWGARDSVKKKMRVNHNDEPYQFEITEALEAALK